MNYSSEQAVFITKSGVANAERKLNPNNSFKMGAFPVIKRGEMLGYGLKINGEVVTEKQMEN